VYILPGDLHVASFARIVVVRIKFVIPISRLVSQQFLFSGVQYVQSIGFTLLFLRMFTVSLDLTSTLL
jgi:hypothetical protein